jgi:serine/threonine protein phosphatase PrpC
VVAASSQGARTRQEDALGHWWHGGDDGPLLAVVADGLGGQGGGAEAARAVVDAAEKLWFDDCSPESCPESFLERWLYAAHLAVLREAERIRCPAMAAVVALVAHHQRVHWIHVGDCRLYRIRDGKTLQRTRDHSVVQELYDLGEIAEF